MPEYLDPARYFGNMQNHQKIYDFERDIIRVKNPLTADFTFIYDSLPIVVPAERTKDMERYLFRRYFWHIMGHIYNQVTELKFEKAHEAFTRTHPDVIDDPYLINEKIWLKLPRFDDPVFQKKVHDDIYIGVVSKFGSNRIVQQPKNGQLDPNTPLFQQLINDDKELLREDTATPEPSLMASQPLPTETQPVTAEEATL